MPWNSTTGQFVRINPNFEGANIWDQDRQAQIKIIATRHDFHDQDMAQGITKCLNVDGYNKMLANIDMNTFKLVNLGDGAAVSDSAAFGQIVGSMTFDNGLRVLELFDRNGVSIDTVTIPSGSGGGTEGTVTQINIGEGLGGAQNPLVSSGDIYLESIGVQQTYSGGISGITVDKHGRVTQVIEGAFQNTNLSNTPDSSTVTVESSTGTHTVIAAAVEDGNAGVMTGLQAKQLADLVAAGVGGGMIPPIQLFGVTGDIVANLAANVDSWCESTAPTAQTTYTPIASDTGAGLIEYMGASVNAAIPGGESVSLRLLIDGIVVWEDTVAFTIGTPTGDGMDIIGVCSTTAEEPASLGKVKYNSSFSLEAKITSTPTSVRSHVRYQKQS